MYLQKNDTVRIVSMLFCYWGGIQVILGTGLVLWVSNEKVNSDAITEINRICNYMQVLFKYKYNAKTCMYTGSALY